MLGFIALGGIEMTRLLLVLLIAFSGAHLSAVDPTTAEMNSVRNWFRAGFYEEDVDSGHDGYLEVQLEHGPLLKNMATTKVHHKQLSALPLKINRKNPTVGEFRRRTQTI